MNEESSPKSHSSTNWQEHGDTVMWIIIAIVLLCVVEAFNASTILHRVGWAAGGVSVFIVTFWIASKIQKAASDSRRQEDSRATDRALREIERQSKYTTAALRSGVHSLVLSNGAGAESNRIIVEVEWDADQLLAPELMVYKSTEQPYGSAAAVCAASNDARLVVRTRDKHLRFSDPDVVLNRVYYYHVFIRIIDASGQPADICFFQKHHTSGVAVESDSLSLADRTVREISRIASLHKSASDAKEAANRAIAGLDGMSTKEIAIIRARVNQFIQREFHQSRDAS